MDQNTNQLADNMTGSFEKSQQHEQAANKLRETSHSIQRERADNQMYGARIDTNLTQEWVNEVGADKLQQMSLHEQTQSANHFTQQKMDTYRHSQFKKLNLDALEKDLNSEYKSHNLAFSAQDVHNNFKTNKNVIERESYNKGLSTPIDDAPKKNAEQMIAMQQTTLQTRGANMKSNIIQAESNFKKQITEHNDQKFTKLQGIQANHLYMKMSPAHEKN